MAVPAPRVSPRKKAIPFDSAGWGAGWCRTNDRVTFGEGKAHVVRAGRKANQQQPKPLLGERTA